MINYFEYSHNKRDIKLKRGTFVTDGTLAKVRLTHKLFQKKNHYILILVSRAVRIGKKIIRKL